MKKQLLQFILLTYSQLVYSQNLCFKPTAGINFCTPSITIAESQKPSEQKILPGFDIGLNLEMKLRSNTSIEVGWFYSSNNASFDRLFYSLVAGSADFPYTREHYRLNFIKAPITILFKQKNENPLYFGIGPVIKFNISSQRNGIIYEIGDSYNTKFKLAGKNGSRTGVGLLLTTGKELKINNLKYSIRLNYDVDLTPWRYPTNFEYEEVRYYSFRNHNFSLLFSINL